MLLPAFDRRYLFVLVACVITLLNCRRILTRDGERLRRVEVKQVLAAGSATDSVPEIRLPPATKSSAQLPAGEPIQSIQFQKDTASSTAPARRRIIPNFLLAGAQKAGSSAIEKYLRELQPVGVVTCGPAAANGLHYTTKEAHYFNNYYDKGLDYYESLFRNKCEGAAIVMDATPNYMVEAKRIRETYDQAGTAESLKILFVLREPVSRELSWYNHLLREYETGNPPEKYVTDALLKQRDNNSGNDVVMSFDEFVQTNTIPSIVAEQNPWNLGLYAVHLQQWFHLFRRDQILVTSYDDFKRNNTDYILRLHSFLEIQPYNKTGPFYIQPSNSQHANHTETAATCSAQDRLAQHYVRPNNDLYQLLDANPGPVQERHPFTRFQYRCKEENVPHNGDEATTT